MTRTIRRFSSIALAAILLLATAAAAQDSKSALSVTELVKMLDSMKLDSFAVKGASPNEYVGALYFPGSQLLVVSAKFDTPWRADSLLEMMFADAYTLANESFERRLEIEAAKIQLTIANLRFEMVKWMFLFWAAELAAITGIVFAIVK